MGWTGYHATHYKNGKVDRKAECDAYFMEGLNRGHFNVLKSSMVGSTYYAAVSPLKKSNGKDDNGNYIYVDIPENERIVFGVVFLTSTDAKDYYNFSYKDMGKLLSHDTLLVIPWIIHGIPWIIPWNSLGQNTGVGSRSLLHGILPTQGWNPGFPQ